MSASGDWEGMSSRAYQALQDIPSRANQGEKECLPELIKTVDKGFTIHTYLTAIRFAKSYVCQHLINHQTPVKFRAHEGPTFYGCAKVPRTFCLYAVMNAISHIVIKDITLKLRN